MKTDSTDNNALQSVMHQANGLSLLDFWSIMLRQRQWAVGLFMVTVASASIIAFTTEPEWEATATIQIGQVGQAGGDREKMLLEPPARAAERMKLRAFQDAVLSRLKVPLDEGRHEADLYRDSLRVRLVPNTDLVEVKVRAYSRQHAAEWVQATVAQLRDIHDRLAEPSIVRLKLQLEQVNKNLDMEKSERDRILREMTPKEQIGPGNRFAENVLLANILNSKDVEIRDLQQRKLVLEELLSPERTYPTSLIDRPDLPEGPVFPKRTMIVGLAIAAGLLASIALALLVDYLQRGFGRR